jgi:vacuolar-type H+-ATPase subunit E/Vma4
MTEEQRMTKARALAQAAWFVHEALERLVDAEARPDLWQALSAVLDAIANDPDAYLALVNAPSDYDCDTTTQF